MNPAPVPTPRSQGLGLDLGAAVQRLAGKRVVIVGDLMLDQYLVGEVSRISPEAPVPVVRVRSERNLLGGAGNVARNVLSLGGSPLLVGVLGQDSAGRALARLLHEEGIASRLVTDPQRPTTRKTRIIAQRQQVCRVDQEETEAVRGETLDQIMDALGEALQAAPVLILSDYGKGLVTRRFMDRLMSLLDSLPRRPWVLVDPKERNFPLYKGVDLLTPNTKEAGEGAGMAVSDRSSILRAGLAIFRKLRCRSLLITLGAEGMALFESPERVLHLPTAAQKVFDVTGAGDTVIAALGLGLAGGLDLLHACALANQAAGVAVGEVGAAAVRAEVLAQRLQQAPAPALEAWLSGGIVNRG